MPLLRTFRNSQPWNFSDPQRTVDGLLGLNYCNVIFVISGGQLIRNGTPTVPMPRVTYI